MLLDPRGIEKYDRALEKRIERFAKLCRKTLRAADEVIWETQAVAKWDNGGIMHGRALLRRERAEKKYDELRDQLDKCIEAYGGGVPVKEERIVPIPHCKNPCSYPTVVKAKQAWCPECNRWTDPVVAVEVA
jgi:hypothetical protein